MRKVMAISSIVVGMLGLLSCSGNGSGGGAGASPTEVPTTSPESQPEVSAPASTEETTTTTVDTPTSAAPTSTTAGDEFLMSGHSMDTAVLDGERLRLDTAAYASSPPRRGDVIVFAGQGGSGQPVTLIKRVIGIGGETLEYRSCVLYVDGAETAEPWLDPAIVPPDSCGGDQPSVAVPQGKVFVMGDNRGHSSDSREWGPVTTQQIVGRAFFRYWPVSAFGLIPTVEAEITVGAVKGAISTPGAR